MLRAHLLSATAVVLTVSPLASQDHFPPESDLTGTYYEGVRTQVNVSAGELSLVAFLTTGGSPRASPDSFTIGFFVPTDIADTRDLDVFVEDQAERLYCLLAVSNG